MSYISRLPEAECKLTTAPVNVPNVRETHDHPASCEVSDPVIESTLTGTTAP